MKSDLLKISFSGRMRRRTYWWDGFVVFGLGLGTLVILLVLIGYLTSAWVSIIIGIPVYIWTTILGFSYTVRRLHDIGKSWKYFLITFIPIVGSILFLLALVKDSEEGENMYGPNPKSIGA